MNINPGTMNKKIEIIQITQGGQNESGFESDPKEKIIRKCWAKVTNTSGTELVKANAEFAEAKKRFLIRWSQEELSTDMIVRYGGKDYDILYINNYQDGKEYTEIWAEWKGGVRRGAHEYNGI